MNFSLLYAALVQLHVCHYTQNEDLHSWSIRHFLELLVMLHGGASKLQ